jgi:N-acetylglucosamine malate deacetylase 1
VSTTGLPVAMVVAAHADDEVLGAGGTIAALARRGWEISVIVMSDGLVRRPLRVDDNRPAAASAAARMGVAPPIFLGFPDQRFDQVPLNELVDTLVGATPPPDLVISHARADLNADHRRTAEAVQVAWRPNPTAPALLAMDVPGSTEWGGGGFAPTYFVDIEDTMEVKLEALAAYAEELRPWPHPRSPEGVRHRAAHHGMLAGLRAAEGFEVIRARAGSLP